MSRQYCENCAYPLSTCVCAAVIPIALPIRVIILQHEKESKHAKNTARLAKLVSPEIEIVVLANKVLVKEVANSLHDSEVLVLYPNNTSTALESYMQKRLGNTSKLNFPISDIALLLIDASWRQAYGIWEKQQWLQQYVHCHLAELQDRQYLIRHSKMPHQLSTIEALANSVQKICGLSGQAYLDVFHYMQNHWLSHIQAQELINNKN